VKYVLTILAIAMLADGLWSHDWRLILASAAVAAIWPLIEPDVTESAPQLRDSEPACRCGRHHVCAVHLGAIE
jgi:hypothetical protein